MQELIETTVLQGIILVSAKDKRDAGDGPKCLDMSVHGRSSPRQIVGVYILHADEPSTVSSACFSRVAAMPVTETRLSC